MSKVILIEAVNPLDEVAPSLTLGYLASFLLKHCGDIDVCITRSTGRPPLRLKHGDIVGITCFTQNYNYAIRLARNLKKCNASVPVIIGGHHVSALPETITDDMDAAVLYEGEETFLRLVQLFLGKAIDKDRLSDVQGIAFHKDGRLIKTGLRGFNSNLDDFPPPERSLMNVKPRQSIEMITSRGCPYRCTYCGSSAFWKKIRFHSTGYVKDEIDSVIERYKPKRLSFVDDLFMANRDRFREIIEHIYFRGYDKNITFYFTGRANMVDEEFCEIIKNLDCEMGFGFESGSNYILKQIKGGNVSVEDNERAIRLLNKYGIKVGAALMIGLPNERIEDMEATYRFIVNNKIHGAAISVVTPLPGTELWDYAFKKRLVNNNMDWDQMRFNDKTSLKNKILINDVVTRRDLEHMFAKINNHIQHLLVTNYALKDLFMTARVNLPFVLRTFVGNPKKIFSFARHIIKKNISTSKLVHSAILLECIGLPMQYAI